MADWHFLYHGTSLYSLRRLCERGFDKGWNRLVGADARGAYGHTAPESSACLGYMIHHPLFNDGIYIGVLVEMYAPSHKLDGFGKPRHPRRKKSKSTGTTSVRNTQWLAFPGHMMISGIYFHLLHQDDINNYPTKLRIAHPWQPELELDSIMSQDAWVRRSKEMRIERDRGPQA